jgi:AraC family transcriptional regulator
MLKPYQLLENILLDIESGIKDNINTSVLCKKFDVSSSHLRRLFTFAFNQSIAAYIRSRALAASLNDILETDANILDIALDYGFEYEQSYIRAFQQEFGTTPGNLRKTGRVLKIKPPLHLPPENKLNDDSIFFGPDIVMVPGFHFIGKSHRVSFKDSADTLPELGLQFWENERKQIKGAVNPHVYFGLTHNIKWAEQYFEYTLLQQVIKIKSIPQDFCGGTFETSMCAGFRYIGQQFYHPRLKNEINKDFAYKMYDTFNDYAQNKQSKFVLVKIDTRLYDGTYCPLEWYSPIPEK